MITRYGSEEDYAYRKTVLTGEDYRPDAVMAQLADHWDRHESLGFDDIREGLLGFGAEANSRGLYARYLDEEGSGAVIELRISSEGISSPEPYLDSIWRDEVEEVLSRAER